MVTPRMSLTTGWKVGFTKSFARSASPGQSWTWTLSSRLTRMKSADFPAADAAKCVLPAAEEKPVSKVARDWREDGASKTRWPRKKRYKCRVRYWKRCRTPCSVSSWKTACRIGPYFQQDAHALYPYLARRQGNSRFDSVRFKQGANYLSCQVGERSKQFINGRGILFSPRR